MVTKAELSIRLLDAPQGQLPLVAESFSIMDVDSLNPEELSAVLQLRTKRQVEDSINFLTKMREGTLEVDEVGSVDEAGEGGDEEAAPADDTGDDSELQA